MEKDKDENNSSHCIRRCIAHAFRLDQKSKAWSGILIIFINATLTYQTSPRILILLITQFKSNVRNVLTVSFFNLSVIEDLQIYSWQLSDCEHREQFSQQEVNCKQEI